MNDTVLVTGGAGFIGSNFVLNWIAKTKANVVNLDLLTYAGNRKNLLAIENDPRHVFIKGDICDGVLVASLLEGHRPRNSPLRGREPRGPLDRGTGCLR